LFLTAEAGIRDGHVTGVQTCALPILDQHPESLQRTCAAGTRDAGRAGGRGVSPLARRAPGDRAGARGLVAARRERLSSPDRARGPRAVRARAPQRMVTNSSALVG